MRQAPPRIGCLPGSHDRTRPVPSPRVVQEVELMWESRVAPLSGALFAILLVASYLVDLNPDFMPPESEVVARIQSGPVRVMTAGYLVTLAAAALAWFSGSGYRALRRLDDDAGRLSVVALAGGVLASSLLAVGGVAVIAAAERISASPTIDPGVGAVLIDLSGVAIGNGAPIGLAVAIAASGIVSLRSGHRFRWFGWVSVLVALGLVSPFGWAVLAAAVLWVPVAAVWLFRSEGDLVPAGAVR